LTFSLSLNYFKDDEALDRDMMFLFVKLKETNRVLSEEGRYTMCYVALSIEMFALMW